MRVRNPSTGTVLGVGEEAGKRYLAAGWVDADAKSTRPTSASSSDTEEKPKPRRRKASE